MPEEEATEPEEQKPMEKPATEETTLHSAGPIPGIPGLHGPGRYLIDWVKRTATPIIEAVEAVAERVEEKSTAKRNKPAQDATPAQTEPTTN